MINRMYTVIYIGFSFYMFSFCAGKVVENLEIDRAHSAFWLLSSVELYDWNIVKKTTLIF